MSQLCKEEQFLEVWHIPSQPVDFLLSSFEIDIPTSNTDIGGIKNVVFWEIRSLQTFSHLYTNAWWCLVQEVVSAPFCELIQLGEVRVNVVKRKQYAQDCRVACKFYSEVSRGCGCTVVLFRVCNVMENWRIPVERLCLWSKKRNGFGWLEQVVICQSDRMVQFDDQRVDCHCYPFLQ